MPGWVVGRKGAGKTAIFYSVRSTYKPSRSHLVLDLKPEGHQFAKLKESVLEQLSPGVQQHVLTAFWNYILLMEVARKIVDDESKLSYQNPDAARHGWAVSKQYGLDTRSEQGDFSETAVVSRRWHVARRQTVTSIASTPELHNWCTAATFVD